MKFDYPPKDGKEEEKKINPLTEELLSLDVLSNKEDLSRFFEITEKSPVLYDEEIKKVLNKFMGGNRNGRINISVLDYLSELRTEDPKTKERTLDRSYRTFFELAEKYPEEASSFLSFTHHMFEFVKPEVFFDVYLKLKTSDELKKYKQYFLGEQFSQLEYNMSYCGTEKYIKALIDKIDFKNTESCFESSQFMNIAASLADYASSGSYSGSYDVDGKILEMFKTKGKDPEAIYLLGAKAQYLSERMESGLPYCEYQRGIFELSPGILACRKENDLFITELSNEEVKKDFEKYESVSLELETPPLELVKQAEASGLSEISWSQDPKILMSKKMYSEKIINGMHKIDSNDVSLSDDAKLSNKQLIEYANLVGTDFRSFLEGEFSIEFKNIKIPEQFFFLEYIQTKKQKDIDELKTFNKKFGSSGFKTFLSIEHGGKEMGDKILTLGEKLPEESAKVLFAKYGEIVDQVDDIGLFLRESMGGKVTPDIIEKAKQNLLIKGKDLLNSYANKADVCVDTECENIGKELEEKLTNIKASLLLFASACKSLSEEGLLSIEDLANTQLEIIHGSVDEKTQEEMKRIFKENRPNYSKPLLDDVTNEFDENLKNTKDNQTFYVLRNNNDITSFMRLDEESDGSIYGASFNVRTELRGSSIGSELLKKIIEDESSKKPFKIICYDKNPMLEKYKSEFGFEIVGTIENYHNTGEKFYEMVRSPKTK